jgi:hypothetical protein
MESFEQRSMLVTTARGSLTAQHAPEISAPR